MRRVLALVTAAACAAAGAPAAEARSPRPNVLLIVTDDQRAAGTMQVMPRTRALFRRGGTRFPNAVATTPTCCPSRASIMSGRYAHNHGIFHNHNQAELNQLDMDSLLAHQLDRAGYRTGIVGKYLNSWDPMRNPPDFDRYAISAGQFYNTSWNIDGERRLVTSYSTRFVRRQARWLLRDWERGDRKPWFLYVAPFAPHGTLDSGGVKLEPESRYLDAPVGALEPNPARAETSQADLADKPAFWRNFAAAYVPGPGAPDAAQTRAGQLRMLISVDDMVGGIFKKLRRTNERRRTLAIFLSDNGLFWGEHGGPPIKDMPYPDAVRIPMFMRWRGKVPRGGTDRRTAATIDLAPTILDAARVRTATSMDGRSLLKSWERQTVLLEYEATGPIPTWASLYEPGGREYTEYYLQNGQVAFREFYDLAGDPWLLDNLYGNLDPADNPPVAPLARELAAARACAGASCP